MPVTIRAVEVTQHAPATSWPGNMPAGIVAGEMLLGLITRGSINGNIIPPSGWFEVRQQSAPSQFRIQAVVRIADGSEGPTATWSHVSQPSRPATTSIFRIGLYSSANGLPLFNSATGSGSDSSAEIPTVDAPENALVLAHGFSVGATPATDPATGDWTPGDKATGLPGETSTIYKTTSAAGNVGGQAFTFATAAWSTAIVAIAGRNGSPPVMESITETVAPGGATWAIDMPATRPAGDLYLFFFDKGGSTGSITPPAGITEITEISSGGSRFSVSYRIGGASEPASYTFSGGTSLPALAHVVRVSNWARSPVFAHAGGNGSDASAELANITILGDTLRIGLMAPAVDEGVVQDASIPDGWDEQVNVQTEGFGTDESQLVATLYDDTTGLGSVGGEAFTIGAGSANWATIHLAIPDGAEGALPAVSASGGSGNPFATMWRVE